MALQLTKTHSRSLCKLCADSLYTWEETGLQHLTCNLSTATLWGTLPWTDKVITNLSSSPTFFNRLNGQQSWSDSYRPKANPAETMSHTSSPPNSCPWNECSSQVSARLQSHIQYTFMLYNSVKETVQLLSGAAHQWKTLGLPELRWQLHTLLILLGLSSTTQPLVATGKAVMSFYVSGANRIVMEIFLNLS